MAHRVALFLPSLSDGGAERVMLNIAIGMAKRPDVTVDLVLIDRSGPYLSQVPSSLRVVDLGAGRIRSAARPLREYLERERPEAIISALDGANLVLATVARTVRPRPKVIVTEHCDFSSAVQNLKTSTMRSKRALATALPVFLRGVYPLADSVVAVSSGVADDLSISTGLRRDDIDVIGNPVINDDIRAKAAEKVSHRFFEAGVPVVLGVGRLTYQKHFDLLVRAFRDVRDATDARLLILGEGPDREVLEGLVEELDLGNDVDLPGFVSNPYAFMSAADVFAMSSRYEGLPTVLIEALYCGARVVSVDCPAGPAEILDGGNYGELVPMEDQAALANGILRALEVESRTTPASSWKPFEEAPVVDEYLQLCLG